MPEISVIIPIYNKEIYLKSCFQFLSRQTFTDYECILIDDGSTDMSGKLCDEAALNDNRISVFHTKNRGVSCARNLGLEKSIGRYITFIDADDGFHEEYLANLYRCISETDAKLVISSSVKVWANSDRQERITVPFLGVYQMEDIMPSFMRQQLNNGIYGFCWGKMFARETIENIRFTEGLKLAEDLDFYLKLYPQIDKIYFDDAGYYYYLQNAVNSSMQKADWEIDYLEQLTINLRLYAFLGEMRGCTGENRELILKRIYDYTFFCLYYAPKHEIIKMSQYLRKLELPGIVDYKNRRGRQRIVLNLFRMGNDRLLAAFIQCIRLLRRVNY